MPNDLKLINFFNKTIKETRTNIFPFEKRNQSHIHIEYLHQHPFISRQNLFQKAIKKKFSYLMKSRPDADGNEPICPLSLADYRRLVAFEKYKFQIMGVKKFDLVSIVFFTINHTVPMCDALMQLGTQYVVLEGNDNSIFLEIIQKKLDVVILTVKQLQRFMTFVEENELISSLRLVITAGEKVDNVNEIRKKVRKVLRSNFVDNIGSRELGGFAYTCPTSDKYHFIDQDQYIEVIDPITKKHSSSGELVISPLWRKDFPMARFKTGDVINLEKKTCDCIIRNEYVFSGIISRLDHTTKLAFGLINPQEVYNKSNYLLHYQYYFDKYLWKFFPKISNFLIISNIHGFDEVFFLIDKVSANIYLRRTSQIAKKIKEFATIEPLFIFVSKDLISEIQKQSKDQLNYLDIRDTKNQKKIVGKFLELH